MADKETGLNIPVSAVADKDSAKEAVNELTKGVLSSLKDGYIEIPAELKVPIKGASKDLEKAQKDVINQWEKTFKQGFSSSAKDLDDLTAAYQRFKKLAGQQHKANTKQSRGISAIMGEPIQEYSMSKKEAQARRNEFKKQIEKAQKRNAKSSKSTTDDSKLLKEEIDNAISKEMKRRYKGLNIVGPKKPKASDINPGATNEQSFKLSESSPYGSNWALADARARREERKKERESLVEYTDKDLAKTTKRGRATTESENATIQASKALNEYKKLIEKIEQGDNTITKDTVKDQLGIVFDKFDKAGKDLEETFIAIKNAGEKIYSDNPKRRLGSTDGEEKGVGPGHNLAQETQKLVYDVLKELWKETPAGVAMMKRFAKEGETATNVIKDITNTLTSTSTRTLLNRNSQYENSKTDSRQSGTYEQIQAAFSRLEGKSEAINRSIKIGNTKQAVDSGNEQSISKENKDINRDTARAVKADAKTEELISLVREILSVLTGGKPTTQPSEKPKLPEPKEKQTLGQRFQLLKSSTDLGYDQIQKILADESNERKKTYKAQQDSIKALPGEVAKATEPPKPPEPPKEPPTGKGEEPESYRQQVEKSRIYASPMRQGIFGAFEDILSRLTGTTRRYEKVLKANADEQDKMAAERIKTYGLNNGRNPNDTGDIAGMRRILQLYRTNKASIEQNPELAQKIQLTPGREVDTTEITKALNKALSGRQMQTAQNGGGLLKNFLGFATGGIGYAFMPSLEKSRAQADGLNQIMGNINKALQSVLINIQTKETELAGMEATGQAKFTKEGYLTSDSTSAAFKTLADLEEEKLVLDSIKADLLANDQIVKKTGGRFSQLVKNLSFTSPVLKENNGILRNINSGLDKNGKALKFQTRLAEVLNYTYQLMSRSIGQMFKNLLSMINPFNLIKKMFEDYASYDPKWQRTMNVIKNNLREIILPFMQKIAQFLVNIIGFLDIISMKIQEAFGYTPISLFDQKNADEFKKTYEDVQDITAGFDELHDIGSSVSDTNPDYLLGEIYKPQLSQGWIDLANEIGDLFAGLIKGDLGFGDVMKRILQIVWDGLQQIWEWFKGTKLGQWLTENWKKILGTMLAAFLAWELLKIAGPALFNALFGKLTSGTIGSLFGKVGGWISKALNLTSFGRGMLEGIANVFNGSGGLIGTLKSIFLGHEAITAFGAWGETLGALFIQGLGVAVGVGVAGLGISKGFDMNADNTSYNIGLMNSGGKEEDKKSNFWGTALGTVSGGVGGAIAGSFLAGASVGGPIGAAIGVVAGLLITSLAPAFEQVEVSARNANNEMQKIEYYEGQVQGAQTQVSELEEMQKLLNDTLDLQTQKVYSEGEQLGITKTRMDELVGAVQNGTFQTSMLSGEEVKLTDSLVQLSDQQTKNKEATEKLEEAKRKLEKAELDLAIAEDVAAGNFELAAARIDYAEAASLYTTEEATKKRIQLYKEAGDEEAAALLQDLTPQQKEKMAKINDMTEDELASFVEKWRESSDDVKEAFLSGVDSDTQNQFRSQMEEIDGIIEEHQGFWQGVGDTLKEIFTFGIADTWTYNGEKKATAEYKSRVQKYATGTNYVPSDGLAYLHQGEAVIPKKYNQPYQPNTMDQAYVDQIITTMRALDNTIQQGITVKGEFRQKGSDLVATVKKAENRNGNQPLNNPVFAR